MSRISSVIVLLMFGCSILASQGTKASVIKQKAEKSPCSNIVALVGNVDLKCSSLTPAQQKLLESIPALLRKILQNEPDPAALSLKMNQVLAELAKPTQSANAPNGIAILGNNLGNPTVNNFAPPPANLTFTEENLTSPPVLDGKKEVKIHIHTDRSIPGAVIGVTMSGPITMTKEYFETHNPSQEGAGSSQVNLRAPLARGGIPIPDSFALVISIPSAFNPGVDLVVPVQALGDYHVLRVEQITQ